MTPTCEACGTPLLCPRCTGAKGGKVTGPSKARPRRMAQKAARASAKARKAKRECTPEQHEAMKRDGWRNCIVCRKLLFPKN